MRGRAAATRLFLPAGYPREQHVLSPFLRFLRDSTRIVALVDVRDLDLRFADVVLNEATREVWRGRARVELTPREFDLLRFFLLNPRRVLTKQQILDRVWDEGFRGEPAIVETYVSYLRRKLDRHGPPLIHTVRLVGYALRETG